MGDSAETATISGRTSLKHKQPVDSQAVPRGAAGGKQPVSIQPASIADVKALLNFSFPGRNRQICEILSLMGGPNDAIPPLLVFGGSATGKTVVLRETLRLLGRPHAYVSCRSCHSPRLLFESVLNQLVGHVRSRAHGYASHRRCDKITDFIAALPEACGTAAQHAKKAAKRADRDRLPPGPTLADPQKGEGGASGSKEKGQTAGVSRAEPAAEPAGPSGSGGGASGRGGTVYILLDNVELMRDWSGGDSLLSAVVRLAELAGLPNLGVILISKVGWDAFRSSTGSREPLSVHFPDYSDEELCQLLQKRHPDDPLYATFLKAVVPPFSRTCRCATELREALVPLYARYRDPVDRGVTRADDSSRLWSLIQPHIRSSLMDTLHIASSSGADHGAGPSSGARGVEKRRKLDFELSQCGKLLLLSAYIASRNPPTLDSALFESAGDNAAVKRKRKASAVSMEKREMQIQEEHLKGPGTFPLERLLAIFRCLIDHSDADSAREPATSSANELEGEEISADVLMQVSTLVATNLLVRLGGDPLDGGMRFRCSADETLASNVAASMHFPLQRYLLHG